MVSHARSKGYKLSYAMTICRYTNYGSRKARELSENTHAALLFFWDGLNRQVNCICQLNTCDNCYFERDIMSEKLNYSHDGSHVTSTGPRKHNNGSIMLHSYKLSCLQGLSN